jgi:hypothetical protein
MNGLKTDFDLTRDPMGSWSVCMADGMIYTGVTVVRPFPISAAGESVAILNAEGHEVVWIEQLAALPEELQNRLNEALNQREFMPVIQRLDQVASFATPSVWKVQTDRGATEFVLKGEEDIRKLSNKTLIISDAHGVQYLIKDLSALDRHTRKLLDRFM